MFWGRVTVADRTGNQRSWFWLPNIQLRARNGEQFIHMRESYLAQVSMYGCQLRRRQLDLTDSTYQHANSSDRLHVNILTIRYWAVNGWPWLMHSKMYVKLGKHDTICFQNCNDIMYLLYVTPRDFPNPNINLSEDVFFSVGGSKLSPNTSSFCLSV